MEASEEGQEGVRQIGRRGSRGPRAVVAVVAAVVLGASALAGCGQHTPSYGAYVALGDSYTAAPGAGAGNVAPCYRSDDNYPHVLAAAIGAELTDVSCSGATLDHLTSPQSAGGRIAPPQLDALTASARLVTLGVGGNDIDVVGYAVACASDALSASSHVCQDRTASMMRKATALEQQLVGAVAQVKTTAPQAKVVLVGYPLIVAASCLQAPLPERDVPLVVQVNTALDTALQQAAAASGATYADIFTPSKGHDICASDPWIAGITGGGAQPLHPKAPEQAAVAGVIQGLL